MINFGIRVDTSKVTRMLDNLKDGVKNRVTQQAVNRVAARVKTEGTRNISSQFNIQQTKVRERIRVSKVSFKGGRFEAVVSVPEAGGKYRALHLTDLQGTKDLRSAFGRVAGQTLRMSRRDRKGNVTGKGGVQYSVVKGRTRIRPNAFIAPGKNSGKLIAFERVNPNDPKSKIKAVYRIDVPQMFNAKRIYNELIRVAKTELQAEVMRLIKVELAKAR